MTLYFSSILALLLVVTSFIRIDSGNPVKRYHQHQERPGEADLDPCAVCDKSGLCTHLPIIVIDTQGKRIPGRRTDDARSYWLSEDGFADTIVSISVIDMPGTWTHADDAPTHVSQARFRYRGNSSRSHRKGSYRVVLTEDDKREKKKKLPLLGMAPGSDWALYGPFMDKSLVRNYVWMNMSAEIMGYAPNVRYCEVIINGEYRGLYILMESIDMQPGRVDLTPYRDGDPTVSYLLRVSYDNKTPRDIHDFCYYTNKWETAVLEVRYPGLPNQNEYVHDYITTDINAFEKHLFSADMFGKPGFYKNFINIDSFINLYMLMEFVMEGDTFQKSTYLYKDVRGKLHVGPVWDFNNVFGNTELPQNEEDTFILKKRSWYGRLLQDRDFTERVIRRWRELRTGILAEEKLVRYHREVEQWLGSAITRNFEVWDFCFDPDRLRHIERCNPAEDSDLTIYDLNPQSYAEAVDWLVESMVNRGRWMDDHIEALRQYSHPSRKT